jgi:catechol 2,3-dioxygenase-like lactoylglutathione lyase family enzyme
MDGTRPRIGTVLETALYVADLPRSIGFYGRVLGFTPTSDPSYKRMCALNVTADQVLLLFKKGASVMPTVTPGGTIPPTDGDGSLHVAFSIPPDDFEAWQEWLIETGLDIESVVAWPDGGRSLYFRDPDEHVIELKTNNWHGKALNW